MAYSPTLGRWTTRDPAGYVDGANLYQAFSSNPSNLVDPLGLKTDKFGVKWDDDVDWLSHPSIDENGWIPGKGYPPGHPLYNTRPDLQKKVDQTCPVPKRRCSECENTKNKRMEEYLQQLTQMGLSATFDNDVLTFLGASAAGAAAGAYGGSKSGLIAGPAGGAIGGVIGAGAGTMAGIYAYGKNLEWARQTRNSILEAYEKCRSNCDPTR